MLAPNPSLATTTVSLQATDAGNYCFVNDTLLDFLCDPKHNPANTNYTTGYIDFIGTGVDIDITYRGFFVFHLSDPAISAALAAGDQLLAANLRAQNFTIRCGASIPVGSNCPTPPPPPPGQPAIDPYQSVSLHGVSGSITDLVNGTGNFSHLGQGTAYASVFFPTILAPETVSTFNLNSAGLAVVSSALGSQLALSSRNSDEEGQITESPIYVFGPPGEPRTSLPVYLDLTFGPGGGPGAAVPGPLPLVGAGAAYGFSRRLRRRRR